MTAASAQTAPTFAAELDGKATDLVVLPFEDWSMKNTAGMRLVPDTNSAFEHIEASLDALV